MLPPEEDEEEELLDDEDEEELPEPLELPEEPDPDELAPELDELPPGSLAPSPSEGELQDDSSELLSRAARSRFGVFMAGERVLRVRSDSN